MQLTAHQVNVIVKLNEKVGIDMAAFVEFIITGIEDCTRMTEKEKVGKRRHNEG